MSEMVERIRSRICSLRGTDDETLARAILLVIREPTEAILAAVIPFPENSAAPRYLMAAAVAADRLAFRTRWQDAIDAMLTEKKG